MLGVGAGQGKAQRDRFGDERVGGDWRGCRSGEAGALGVVDGVVMGVVGVGGWRRLNRCLRRRRSCCICCSRRRRGDIVEGIAAGGCGVVVGVGLVVSLEVVGVDGGGGSLNRRLVNRFRRSRRRRASCCSRLWRGDMVDGVGVGSRGGRRGGVGGCSIRGGSIGGWLLSGVVVVGVVS